MKIFYTITKSEAGGAQTHVFQLSKYMKEKGHTVAIMSFPGGELEKLAKENNITFHPNIYFKNSFNPILGLKAMKRIAEVVDVFKPDIVSCHSSIAGFWTRLVIKNKIPTIFTAHGWGFTDGVSKAKKIIVSLAERIAGRYCNKIICVSEYDRQLALKNNIVPREKLITIHNGVELFQREKTDNIINIVFIGRLSEQKDPELLINAFSELKEENTNLLIIGGGEKEERLKKTKRDNVLITGSLTRAETLNKLKNADIFVLTSFWEGFPRSILEAMSFGLPVIASDVGGVSEIVDNSVGYLIKRGDKEGLKRTLKELIDNKAIRLEKGNNARKRIEESFTLDKMLSKTEQVYLQ